MLVYELSIDALNATELFFPIEGQKERLLELAEDKISNGISVKEKWDDFIVLKKEPQIDMDFYDIEDTGITILSQKAYRLLSTFFDDTIETLPLRSDDETFYLLNVIGTTDCFDKKNAVYSAIEGGQREQILDFQDLSFFPDKIKSPVFRIPELPYKTFLTDKLITIYYNNFLRGLNLTDEEYIWNEY